MQWGRANALYRQGLGFRERQTAPKRKTKGIGECPEANHLSGYSETAMNVYRMLHKLMPGYFFINVYTEGSFPKRRAHSAIGIN